VVLHSTGDNRSFEASIDVRQLAADMGLPLFLSMRGAAVALRKLAGYSMAYPERLAGLAAPAANIEAGVEHSQQGQ